jgi:hypothetical protein
VFGNVDAQIKAIYHPSKKFVPSISSDTPEMIGMLLDKTCMYAESGGQEYDMGSIVIDGVAEFAVENVQVFKGYVLHTGVMKYGELKVGDSVVASYDEVSLVTFPRLLYHQLPTSSVVGLYGTTTPQPTSSIGLYARLSATTLTKRARSLHPPSFASTFPTSSRSRSPSSLRSRNLTRIGLCGTKR